jgi:hypothetical protein
MNGPIGIAEDVIGCDHHHLRGNAHTVSDADSTLIVLRVTVTHQNGVGLNRTVLPDGHIALNNGSQGNAAILADFDRSVAGGDFSFWTNFCTLGNRDILVPVSEAVTPPDRQPLPWTVTPRDAVALG